MPRFFQGLGSTPPAMELERVPSSVSSPFPVLHQVYCFRDREDLDIPMKEFLTNVLHYLGQAYWIEIQTEQPDCTYYFGPFLTAQDAEAERQGYQEDLEQEGSTCIRVRVKRCKPTELTITEDWGDWNGYGFPKAD